MKQFSAIFGFEYRGIVKSKVYIIVTVCLAVLLLAATFLPTVIGLFDGGEGGTDVSPGGEPDRTVAVLTVGDRWADGSAEALAASFGAADGASSYVVFGGTEEEAEDEMNGGAFDALVVVESLLRARYVTKSQSMYDTSVSMISEILKVTYLTAVMTDAGISAEDAVKAAGTYPVVEAVETGKSYMASYICAYAMIMFLYMAVLLYGNMVSTSVATEKSSRAMELLITTARPNALLFGKVLGVGMAAVTQLGLLIAVTAGGFLINRASYEGIPMVGEAIAMCGSSVGYLLIFFLLGFFLYAFLFGALGSTITRLEEANTASFPIIMLILVALMISMFAMSSGDVDGIVVVVASFIPFFAPMVMFVRICMSEVPAWQIVVSVLLMVAGNGLCGILAARIYRLGVLMYGKPPKLKELLLMLSRTKNE